MASYVPDTKEEQKDMLKEIGYSDFDDLFSDIPQEVRLKDGLNIPEGMAEQQVKEALEEIAGKDKIYRYIFRGAGAYDHYIPSIVKSVTSKEEFVTAYTPYQAELSQGILQVIFEYQTMICELTGMDVSNASVYDGATAAAEALTMCRDRRHSTAYVSESINPQTMEVLKTYCFGSGTKLVTVPEKDGETDAGALAALLADDKSAACFYVQQPNYYGILEDIEALTQTVHDAGARIIVGCNPIALALIKTPGECGADIAVGEGQPLGIPLSFGGPYLGFMAATSELMRKLPGRIVGETTDSTGERAFVLTLQAREQHIRREKASSNICSNEALCALTASVYLAAMGPGGLADSAALCMSKAHYLCEGLAGAGLRPKYQKEFFHEFVTVCPGGDGKDVSAILDALDKRGILGGLPLGENEILWCATEKCSKTAMDEVISVVKGVCAA